jgi:hypothetical protein
MQINIGSTLLVMTAIHISLPIKNKAIKYKNTGKKHLE